MKSFTKDDTNLIKGIAIISMILHHFIKNSPALSLFEIKSINFVILIGEICKVCVSLFAIMSGYGLSEKYKKLDKKTIIPSIKFVLSHYISFISTYFCVYMIMGVLTFREQQYISKLYGKGGIAIINALLDLLGLRNLFSGYGQITDSFFGDWFVTAIIVFYFVFPILWHIIDKIGKIFLVISYIPWLFWLISKFFYKYEINSDNILFYIFSFSLGIYMSQHGKLYIIKNNKKNLIKAFGFTSLVIVLRVLLTLPMDCYVAICLIISCIYFVDNYWIKKILNIYGKYSANIWLLNIFIISIIKPRFKIKIIGFLAVLLVGLFSSIIIEKAKDISGYNILVKKIRKIIEK